MSLDARHVMRVDSSPQRVTPATAPVTVTYAAPHTIPRPAPHTTSHAATLVSRDTAAPPDPQRLRRWRFRQSAALLTADTVVLTCVALLLSSGPWAAETGMPSPAVTLLVTGLWLVILACTGGYRVRGVQLRSLLRSTTAASTALVSLVAVIGLLAQWGPAREVVLFALPAGFIGLLSIRLMWRARLHRRIRGIAGLRRILVLGDFNKAQHICRQLQQRGRNSGYVVAEVLTWGQQDPTNPLDGPGAVAQARDAVLSTGADLVVLAGTDALDAAAVRRLAWELAELDVELATASGLSDVAGWRLRSESIDGLAVVHVDLPRLRGAAACFKRAFDIVFSLVVLVLISPMMLLISAAVKADSRGSALFRQERVGVDHSRFEMLKFRSMTTDAEVRRAELLEDSDGNSILFKMRHDPRVTRVGRVLRRCSLDELPQFLNVLRGDMSVVGPRPPLASETEDYDDHADHRMTVKPGITGLWQVTGRSDLSWDESLRLDLYYVENWSPAADIRIVLRTVWAVCTGAGAY